MVAHYFTFLIFEGQAIATSPRIRSGEGWDLFGTASVAVDYGVLSQDDAWYLEVGFVVAGHVAALALAHDRALVLYRRSAWRRGRSTGCWRSWSASPRSRCGCWRRRAHEALRADRGGCSARRPWPARAADGSASAGRSTRLVDFSKKPPFVNALDIDPSSGDFLLTTNRGFFRIDADEHEVKRLRGTISAKGEDVHGRDLPAVKVTRPAHADRLRPSRRAGALPRSSASSARTTAGAPGGSCRASATADLHKIVISHDRMYAFDAVFSAILISDDGGRTFAEHFTPRGLIIDFEVDPATRARVALERRAAVPLRGRGRRLAAGRAAEGIRLAWPAPDVLYRADKDGTVTSPRTGATPGRTWGAWTASRTSSRRSSRAAPYLALSDGTIMETTDGARSWKAVFEP